MGEVVDESADPATVGGPRASSRRKMGVLPLVTLIFFDVSGGPFLSLLGFLLLSLFWSLPEALVTAELAAGFPANGGYVLWISSSFGPFCLFQGERGGRQPTPLPSPPSITAASASSARCPRRPQLPQPPHRRPLHHPPRRLLPLPLPRPPRNPATPLARPGSYHVGRRGYFNSMLWNLNYWDKAGTLAGEVEDPTRPFPRAHYGAVVLLAVSYLIPLLAGTGSMDASKTGVE